jgi:phage anti-repressor protein
MKNNSIGQNLSKNNQIENYPEVINRDGKQAVSARELHAFLEIQTPFNKWMPRMLEYGFAENTDWTKMSTDNQQYSFDYVLSLDCAKEISMIQRSPQGKKARQYFIECEKSLKQVQIDKIPTLAELMVQSANLHVQHEKDIKELKQEQTVIKGQIAQMVEEKKQNEVLLFDLPISNDPVPDLSVKAQVRVLVAKYALATGISFSLVYDAIYSDLYFRYGILLRGHKRASNESLLDVAERIKCINYLHAIISKKVTDLSANQSK